MNKEEKEKVESQELYERMKHRLYSKETLFGDWSLSCLKFSPLAVLSLSLKPAFQGAVPYVGTDTSKALKI